ncbi:MAG: OmpA family protein [Alphaproteobacteria bacterium]|nr:OmpA family protein [Alphaproteobacteria bacterium]
MLNTRFKERTNAWPGFVDLFSNLVIILIFLLIVFVFLWTTTSVFNKNTGAKKVAELEQAKQAQAEQIEQMNADKQEAEQLLLAARDALENQEGQIENQMKLANAYEDQISALTVQQEQLAAQIAALTEQLQLANAAKTEMARLESERHELNDEMSKKQSELNARITELESQLRAAEQRAKEQETEYTQMSNRLNKALAEKVAELNSLAQYQSDFYKQVKTALGQGETTGIKPEGDRFILSSDILFGSGSYKISNAGKKQIKILADLIKGLENKIPKDIDWIVRIDGHTDSRLVIPGTKAYWNNMQLSLLRAASVADELIKNGVSVQRLIPSGFGDMYPIAQGKDAKSMQLNRRIELQLTNK